MHLYLLQRDAAEVSNTIAHLNHLHTLPPSLPSRHLRVPTVPTYLPTSIVLMLGTTRGNCDGEDLTDKTSIYISMISGIN